MPEISVIIPIYNAEKYIRQCIESVLSQTYADFELVLVNDGSIDGSLDICKEYEKMDKRIYVINKENEGVSVARNTAIAASRGKYITFIDADDYVDRDYLKDLYHAIIMNKAEISISGYVMFTDSDNIVRQCANENISLVNKDNFYEFVVKGMLNCIMRVVCCKLFMADIIKKNDIQFRSEIPIGEDTIFILEYIKYAKCIATSNSCMYYYRQYDNQSTKKYHELNYSYYCETLRCIYNLLKLNGVSDNVWKEFYALSSNNFAYLMYYYVTKSRSHSELINNIINTINELDKYLNWDFIRESFGNEYVDLLSSNKIDAFVRIYKKSLGFTKINKVKLNIKGFLERCRKKCQK